MSDRSESGKWITEGILIALGTGYIYLLSFAFELGYCRHFGIPAYLINPNISTVLVTATSVFGVIGGGYFLLSFVVTAAGRALAKPGRPRLYRLLVLQLALVAISTWFISATFGFTKVGFLWFVGGWGAFFAVRYGLGLLIFRSHGSNTMERLAAMDAAEGDPGPDWITAAIARMGPTKTLVALSLVMIPIIVLLVGEGIASNRANFLAFQEEPNLLIIRVYGDTVVARSYINGSHRLGPELILRHLDSSKDLRTNIATVGPFEEVRREL
ncbi:hypothetical protein [Bordetella sp. LUAb4]|uniref:hypothetical protein n=1 Tax=Bordetella sp. LUAb4 TaxID=2843195 RepID=UPI001E3280EB|nr:hypothetical protein [Bordetella sp. LUAb4]